MVWSPFSLHTCPLSAISTPVCCHTFSPAYKSCGQTASPSCTHTLCLCRLFFRRPIVVCLPAGLWELLLFVPSQDYLPVSASTKPTPQPACIVFYWEGGLGIFFISYIGNALGINLLANINKWLQRFVSYTYKKPLSLDRHMLFLIMATSLLVLGPWYCAWQVTGMTLECNRAIINVIHPCCYVTSKCL